MRYAEIEFFEITNGVDCGISLYTQGCPFHCKGCHNPETWNYDGGKLFTLEKRDMIVDACNQGKIKRFTILGGEPLIERNKSELMALCALIKAYRPDIKIWLYTGNLYEDIEDDWYYLLYYFIDVLVDGRFELDKRDITLPFRGSTNQRIIDVNKTIDTGKVTLYDL